ncbi:uncharacterized protein BO88DRAFT_427224 [Aspergillus vadensis CBS 113365]|uniref:Uncharacterized protein n=1 Tax=Aspergillus vadensis (strain CBS 113365 / IMI 142717 / IBT 24658) TaxID=1448311 RepID=A0A319CF84_ASPVC|nr:hypothetical protein BO88DRAFT_427224 [Aspergillus vadensis CBS 113365]PYH67012.1 hypothetical protein BO88DRAFT_427224 [Aspergillus vadensis CBS 113365]
MSPPIVHHSAAPIPQPTPLLELNSSLLSDDDDSTSNSSASVIQCPCCASPDIPDLATLAETIPGQELSMSTSLEDRFLNTLMIQSGAESAAEVVAIVPQDWLATGNWSLINLLCHRAFAAVRHQAAIRNFGVYYYRDFGAGDTLTAVSRTVVRGRLTWLETTVT